MMATGLLMASSLLSLTRAGYELEMLDSFEPTAGSIIGTITIGDYMHFELDVTIHSIPSGWASVFHCGSENGIRMPALFMHPYSATDDSGAEGFHTCWTHDDNSNDCIQTEHFTVGQTYHIEIDVTDSLYTVTQDGVVQSSDSKADHTTYDSMVCYASDPWYTAADVTLSNIRVWAGDEPTTTDEPSPGPTDEPTTTKDCSVLHIDDFLTDCSDEFESHDTDIKGLQEDVSSVTVAAEDNAADIASLVEKVADLANATEAVATNAADIASVEQSVGELSTASVLMTTNAAAIATLEESVQELTSNTTSMASSIDGIQEQVTAINEQLSQLGDWAAAAAAHSPLLDNGDWMAGKDGEGSDWTVVLTAKELIILALVAVPMVLITALFVMCSQPSGRRAVYDPVSVITESEQEKLGIRD